jgi:hypothetical protein
MQVLIRLICLLPDTRVFKLQLEKEKGRILKIIKFLFSLCIVSIILVSCTGGPSGTGEIIQSPAQKGMTAKFEKTIPYFKEVYAISPNTQGIQNVFGSTAKGAFLYCNAEQQKQLQQLMAAGRCPAGFLNKNKRMLIILSDNPKVTSGLQQVKQGDKVLVNGSEVKFVGLFDSTDNKIDYRLTGMSADKQQFVYINNITINGVLYN